MGINFDLVDEDGNIEEPGDVLGGSDIPAEDSDYPYLRLIDPWGDTTFGRLQMRAVVPELERWSKGHPSKAVLKLLELARKCGAEPHSYINSSGISLVPLRVASPTLDEARGLGSMQMSRRSRALALVAAVALAGCGGAAVSNGPSLAATDAPDGSAAPASSITITRSGGIAGMHDVVEIAPDNSAHVTPKSGVMSVCTPSVTAIDRIRAMDLAALGPAPSKTPIMDGFGYEIVAGAARASVGDGDSGPHGELLSAAAEVVSSCLATISPPSA